MNIGGRRDATAPRSDLGPYEPDNARRMPLENSISGIAAGRRKRAEIIGRSGRSSTMLVGKRTRKAPVGAGQYTNTFLGDV